MQQNKCIQNNYAELKNPNKKRVHNVWFHSYERSRSTCQFFSMTISVQGVEAELLLFGVFGYKIGLKVNILYGVASRFFQ